MRLKKIFQILIILTGLLGSNWTIAGSNLSPVHRFHSTLTRLDYNADQKLVEVSIQLFTHDLVPLLEKRTRRRVDLEKTADIDKHILSYLKENFVLMDKDGNPKEFKWVGKESDADAVWVYLETSADETVEGYSLQNTLFFESFPEQTNLVICRFEEKKADLIYKTGDKIKTIKANKTKQEN